MFLSSEKRFHPCLTRVFALRANLHSNVPDSSIRIRRRLAIVSPSAFGQFRYPTSIARLRVTLSLSVYACEVLLHREIPVVGDILFFSYALRYSSV